MTAAHSSIYYTNSTILCCVR